jgi:GTP-binding protein HflX
VDISHPQFEDHINVVNDTLREIGAGEKPVILVFNKIDAYHFIPKEEDDLTPSTRENITLEELKRTWIARINGKCVFISATNRTNIEELRQVILENVKQIAEKNKY